MDKLKINWVIKMNVLKDFAKFALISIGWFFIFIIASIAIVVTLIFYEEELTKYHMRGIDPIIYNAHYLDNFERIGGSQKIFLVKHSIFNKTTCDEVKDWIQNNVDKNKLHDTIEVYEYDNDIRENAIGLKNEYDALLFGLDLCEFKKDEFQ